MLILGVAFAILFLLLYFRKVHKASSLELIDLSIVTIAAVFFGVVFAILFENFYEWIQKGKVVWTWGMTFYGGLFGGVVAFVLFYIFFYKKKHQGCFDKILIIAPVCITAAHGTGRIGCFLEGCCYGKETDSWIGVVFKYGAGAGVKRIPTQLIEAIFLFVLCAILAILAFKKICKYTPVIYLASYGVFRFVIEFFRDDYRGQIAGFLSPSQIWCILLIIGAIVMFFLQKKRVFEGKNENEN